MVDEPEFLGLEDVPFSVADDDWYSRHRDEPPERTPAKFSTMREFAAVEEIPEPALLGTRSDTILPANGVLLMYGDGGAGKTTLSLDAVVHLADGREWLGLEVGKPVRSLVIENEGPRAKFRQILNEKLATLNGSSAGDEISILEEPWTQFTVADPGLREDVAGLVNEREVDLIVLGPLATVGMVGGGTPDEISRFEALLRELREGFSRPVAFWIVHHENKSGDVSGAWERVPDTLVHVQGAGNGHTRFVFRKARWSSEFHGSTLNLVWTEGRTFAVAEPDDRDYYADVLKVFRDDDRWRTVHETRTEAGIGMTSCQSVLAELVRRGDLMFEKGPAGRHFNANCYRLNEGTVLRLVPDNDSPRPPDDFEF